MTSQTVASAATETSAEEWIAGLRGQAGHDVQQILHERLTTYLFVVARNTLKNHRQKKLKLRGIDDAALTDLAEDFVQKFALKLITNDYQLLNKYGGSGRFLAWTAQIMRNLIGDELRRSAWRRIEDSAELQSVTAREQDAPESSALWHFFDELIAQFVQGMSTRNRTIFTRYILDGASAESVADELAMSVNAVYIAVHRIRAAMSKILTQAGYGLAAS